MKIDLSKRQRASVLFFITFVFVSTIVGIIWNMPIADVGTKFATTIAIVVFFGGGPVYAYFTYKKSIPTHLIYRWEGVFLFLAMLCFIVYAFADMYCEVGLIDSTSSTQGNMQTCLYFSILTFIGASYGDVIPSELARFFVVIQTVLGYFSFAFIVAIMLDALRSGAHSN